MSLTVFSIICSTLCCAGSSSPDVMVGKLTFSSSDTITIGCFSFSENFTFFAFKPCLEEVLLEAFSF